MHINMSACLFALYSIALIFSTAGLTILTTARAPRALADYNYSAAHTLLYPPTKQLLESSFADFSGQGGGGGNCSFASSCSEIVLYIGLLHDPDLSVYLYTYIPISSTLYSLPPRWKTELRRKKPEEHHGVSIHPQNKHWSPTRGGGKGSLSATTVLPPLAYAEGRSDQDRIPISIRSSV